MSYSLKFILQLDCFSQDGNLLVLGVVVLVAQQCSSRAVHIEKEQYLWSNGLNKQNGQTSDQVQYVQDYQGIFFNQRYFSQRMIRSYICSTCYTLFSGYFRGNLQDFVSCRYSYTTIIYDGVHLGVVQDSAYASQRNARCQLTSDNYQYFDVVQRIHH